MAAFLSADQPVFSQLSFRAFLKKAVTAIWLENNVGCLLFQRGSADLACLLPAPCRPLSAPASLLTPAIHQPACMSWVVELISFTIWLHKQLQLNRGWLRSGDELGEGESDEGCLFSRAVGINVRQAKIQKMLRGKSWAWCDVLWPVSLYVWGLKLKQVGSLTPFSTGRCEGVTAKLLNVVWESSGAQLWLPGTKSTMISSAEWAVCGIGTLW